MSSSSKRTLEDIKEDDDDDEYIGPMPDAETTTKKRKGMFDL